MPPSSISTLILISKVNRYFLTSSPLPNTLRLIVTFEIVSEMLKKTLPLITASNLGKNEGEAHLVLNIM
jgi:hypothetical protein